MTCPKCGFEQSGGRSECLRCGVIFEKYRKINRDPMAGRKPIRREPANERREADSAVSSGIKSILLHVESPVNPFSLAGRVLLLLFLLIWGFRFISAPLGGDFIGESFLHKVNLPFHEAGHLFFRPLGQFMMMLGGSLTQCIIPSMCLLVLLLKTRDPFGASVSLWWLGENFIDLAPYINDARALELVLLGGVTGRDVEDFHDWEFILRKTGLLQYDHSIALLLKAAGASLILAALLWGGAVIYRQMRTILE